MSKIRNIGIVTVSIALSRMLGFVRVSIIGFLFGATGQADVLNLVFQIPNNLRRLLAEGALSAAFIPVLGDGLSDTAHANRRTRTFVQSVLGFQLYTLVPLLLLSTLFAAPLTALLFDFRLPQQVADAELMFRILIWYILPISINAVFMAILNTHTHFTVPALSPLVSSIVVISLILALHASFGIYAVGIALLCGGAMQVVIHIPHLIRYRYRLIPTFDIKNSDFRRALKKWMAIVLGALLAFLNQQVAAYFASGLEVGSGSALVYAFIFWQLPFGILGISVLTVLYPKMSVLYAHGQIDGLRRTFGEGARYLMYVMLSNNHILCVVRARYCTYCSTARKVYL